MAYVSSSSYSPKSYPRDFMLWQARGLSARASSLLALAGISGIEQLQRLDRAAFEGHRNAGPKTLDEIADLAGWNMTTPLDAIAAALSMTVHGQAECREIAADIAMSLQRAGFSIVATASTAECV